MSVSIDYISSTITRVRMYVLVFHHNQSQFRLTLLPLLFQHTNILFPTFFSTFTAPRRKKKWVVEKSLLVMRLRELELENSQLKQQMKNVGQH